MAEAVSKNASLSEKLDPQKFKELLDANKHSTYMKKHKCAELLPLDQDIIDRVCNFDSFKMFHDDIEKMSKSFHLCRFGDCAQITEPKIQDLIYVVIEGQVAIIDNQ